MPPQQAARVLFPMLVRLQPRLQPVHQVAVMVRAVATRDRLHCRRWAVPAAPAVDQTSPATAATAATAALVPVVAVVALLSTTSATPALAVQAAAASQSRSLTDDQQRNRRSIVVAVRATRVTVTDTATPLIGSTADYQMGSSALIRNRGSVSVYVGGSGVTTATGYELEPGDAIPVDL